MDGIEDIDREIPDGEFGTVPDAIPLIGRLAELDVLRRRLGGLAGGRGGIVALEGPAGIGKSRLVREALRSDEARRARLLVGRGQAVAQASSFHPFTDLLRGWAGIAAGAEDGEALARLDEAVGAACGADAADIVPFVASLMGLRLEGERAERLRGIEGDALEGLIVRSMRTLFQCLAESRPLVLFFEDVHWADRSSVQLLEMLFRLIAESPILFILALRPDAPETGQRLVELAREKYPLQQTLIRLEPLAGDDCVRLAGAVLGAEDVPAAVSDLIEERADGSPLFVVEMARALIDEGAVERRAGGLRLAESFGSIAVPYSLREVIGSRLARLEPAAREVLEVGAVIGRSFPGRVLLEVIGTLTDLETQLGILVERGLLVQRRTRRTAAHARRTLAQEVEYVFQHALVQETLYAGLDSRLRRQLHGRVAAAIEKVYSLRLHDFHGMLAYHYVRAEELEKAEEFLFKAGEEAARAAASREALAFFREASAIYLRLHGEGGNAERKSMLERNIGLALMNTGALAEAMPHFDRALAHLGRPVPATLAGAALRFGVDLVAVGARLVLPAFLFGSTAGRTEHCDEIRIRYPRIKAQSTSDPTRLVFDYVRAVRLLNSTDPAVVPDQVIGLYSGFAALFAYSGLSFGLGRRYLALADGLRRPGNAKDLFDHSCLVCICNYLEGRWNDADGTVPDDVVQAALRAGGLWEVNTYLGLDADRRLRRGDFPGARRRIEQLDDIAETYGFEFARTNAISEAMLLALEERRLDVALDLANVYRTTVAEDPLRVLALGSRGKAEVLLGDQAAAARTLADAAGIVDRAPIVPPWHLSAYAVARLLHDLEALEAAAGDAEVVSRARTSARLARRVAAKVAVQRGEILRLTARFHRLLGRDAEAVGWLARALAECEKLGALPELARIHLDAAAWAADLGDGRGPAEHLARARDLAGLLGLPADRTAARRAA